MDAGGIRSELYMASLDVVLQNANDAKHNNNRLELHTRLMRAIQRSDLDALDALVSQGAPVQRVLHSKKIPLISASIIGRVNIVEALLAYGANPNASDGNNDTPLHWASYMGNSGTVQRLVEAKANVELVGFENKLAVEVAIEKGHPGVVRVLRAMHYEPLLQGIRDELNSTLLLKGIQGIILEYCTPQWW